MNEIKVLHISLSSNCNLNCVYCDFESNKHNKDMGLSEYKFVIKHICEMGIQKIRFAGCIPDKFDILKELIKFINFDLRISDIEVMTNGSGIEEELQDLKNKGLRSININLDSLKVYKYKEVTGGATLQEPLKVLQRAIDLGIKTKISPTIVKHFNEDEIYDFFLMSRHYPIEVNFIELSPVGKAEVFFEHAYIDVAQELYKYENLNLERVKIQTEDSVIEQDYNRIIITSNGTIKPFLHAKYEISISEYIYKPLLFGTFLKEFGPNRKNGNYFKYVKESEFSKCLY
jgi:cyclic pyranopterin phosphate synthase